MIFACRTPHTPATHCSRTDGLDMKVSTRQKQGATRHKRAGAIGDNSASCVPKQAPGRGLGLPLEPISVPLRARVSKARWGCAPDRGLRLSQRRYPAGYVVFVVEFVAAGSGSSNRAAVAVGFDFVTVPFPTRTRHFIARPSHNYQSY